MTSGEKGWIVVSAKAIAWGEANGYSANLAAVRHMVDEFRSLANSGFTSYSDEKLAKALKRHESILAKIKAAAALRGKGDN